MGAPYIYDISRLRVNVHYITDVSIWLNSYTEPERPSPFSD